MRTTQFFRRRMGALFACRRGNSAIEFAFAAPVLLLGLIGIVEMSLVMFVSVLTEGGLREASRYGITGREPDGITREEQLVSIVKDHTLGLVEISPDNVTFKVYESFDHIGQEEPYDDANGNGQYDDGESFTDWNGNGVWDVDSGVLGVGGSGDIVVYEIAYQWAFLTPLFRVFGDDGKLNLSATIAVRNEPYDAGGDDT
ncbi:MAG: TadE/TadG family type IV pilus assembly protein [Kiloniellales bacterium]